MSDNKDKDLRWFDAEDDMKRKSVKNRSTQATIEGRK